MAEAKLSKLVHHITVRGVNLMALLTQVIDGGAVGLDANVFLIHILVLAPLVGHEGPEGVLQLKSLFTSTQKIQGDKVSA